MNWRAVAHGDHPPRSPPICVGSQITGIGAAAGRISPLARQGETMTTAAMVTDAYDQIDQVRTELNAAAK
jgi:hypothetical protein